MNLILINYAKKADEEKNSRENFFSSLSSGCPVNTLADDKLACGKKVHIYPKKVSTNNKEMTNKW